MRRHVEVADQYVPVVAAWMQRLAGFHLVEELQLVVEFRIERGIGNVAAGRHVEIMHDQRLCQLRLFAERNRDVPRIDLVAEGADVLCLERQFRNDGDAVVALLPVQRDVLISEPLESLQRKGVVDAFGFLKAQHVRPRRFEEFGDDVDAQAHRVDIPRCQGKTHGGDVPSSSEERPLGRVSKDELSVWPSFAPIISINRLVPTSTFFSSIVTLVKTSSAVMLTTLVSFSRSIRSDSRNR